jgi:hypothetical protein
MNFGRFFEEKNVPNLVTLVVVFQIFEHGATMADSTKFYQTTNIARKDFQNFLRHNY